MKYTVLGATGFIGSNLVAYLRGEGCEVLAPDKADTSIFTKPLGHVFYCIGLTADFRTRPFDTVRAHVSVLVDVLERTNFSSLTYLSSTRAYAKSAGASEHQLFSVNPDDPSDLYNLSKLTGESLCRSCGRSGVKVARLSNVVGFDLQSDNFIFTLIREALSGRITLQTDLASSKDYIWIDDVVRLLPRIATVGQHSLYNVASGINLSHSEIVARLVSLTGCAMEIIEGASQLSFPVIDIRRIRQEFNFAPSPVIEVLPEIVRWVLKSENVQVADIQGN